MTDGQPATVAAAEAVMVRAVDDTMPQHPLFSASLSRVSEACPFANREINVQVYGGQVVWLRGPSGAGKTLYVSYPLPLHIYPTSTVLNRPLTLSVYHQSPVVSLVSSCIRPVPHHLFLLHHPCTISRLVAPHRKCAAPAIIPLGPVPSSPAPRHTPACVRRSCLHLLGLNKAPGTTATVKWDPSVPASQRAGMLFQQGKLSHSALALHRGHVMVVWRRPRWVKICCLFPQTHSPLHTVHTCACTLGFLMAQAY